MTPFYLHSLFQIWPHWGLGFQHTNSAVIHLDHNKCTQKKNLFSWKSLFLIYRLESSLKGMTPSYPHTLRQLSGVQIVVSNEKAHNESHYPRYVISKL